MTPRTPNPSAVYLRTTVRQLARVLVRADRLGHSWRRFAFVEFDAIIELDGSPTNARLPDNTTLLSNAPNGLIWIERAKWFTLFSPRLATPPVPCSATIRVPLRLRRHTSPITERESLWILDMTDDLFVKFDERILRRFTFARVRSSGRTIWVLRANTRRHTVLAPPFQAFVPHAQHTNLHLPAGATLSPSVQAERLGSALGVNPRYITWIEDQPTGLCVHRVWANAFRPLDAFVTYTAPPTTRLTNARRTASPLALPSFALLADQIPTVTPAVAPRTKTKKSLVGKWLEKIWNPKRQASDTAPATRPTSRMKFSPKSDDKRKVSQAVQTLIDRVIRSHLTDSDRGRVWADLATVLMTAGESADAAVCWMNAIWEKPNPPAEWFTAWVWAEEQEAGNDPTSPRLAAAKLAALEGNDTRERLRIVDIHEPDLPVRAVWLARLGASCVTSGDALGLARCRDRLLNRLTTTGVVIGTDAPGFLRTHGGDADGVRATWHWLAALREPIHHWIRRQSSGNGLTRAGLDFPIEPTVAVADLILVWGLNRLGDCTTASQLLNEAGHIFRDGKHTNPVHTAIHDLFQDRIRSAQSTVNATAMRPNTLSAHRHYVLETLIARLSVLSADVTSSPWRELDLMPILGADSLAVRLAEMVRKQSTAILPELLIGVTTDPTARTLPRVILAATELGSHLDPTTAVFVLKLLPRAIELLPEAMRLNGISGPAVHTLLVRLVSRAIISGCSLARRHHLPAELETLVRCLNDHQTQGDGVIRAAVLRQLPRIITTQRRLGLQPSVGRTIAAAGVQDSALGLYLSGRSDAAMKPLNAMRDALFANERLTDRERAEAAFTYVAALVHAPPDVARERLTDLFEMLGRVPTAGTTSRYFALRPLELVDAAVSAVVADRFPLSPTVRSWLDDDEFRIRRRITQDLNAALKAD